MISSPYPIIVDWDNFSEKLQNEVAKKLFLEQLIRNNYPENVDVYWENTHESSIIQSIHAVNNNEFGNVRVAVDILDEKSCMINFRADSEYIELIENDVIVAKKLVYTSSINITNQNAHIIAEISDFIVSEEKNVEN